MKNAYSKNTNGIEICLILSSSIIYSQRYTTTTTRTRARTRTAFHVHAVHVAHSIATVMTTSTIAITAYSAARRHLCIEA